MIFAESNVQEYSIIDPIQPSLDKELIVNGKINPEVKQKIMKVISKLSIDVKNVWIIGSSLTHQWTPESDIDVTLFVDHKYKKNLKDLNTKLSDATHEKVFFQKHPINFHCFVGSYNEFKADAIYDLLRDKWIKRNDPMTQSDLDELIKGCSNSDEFRKVIEEYTDLVDLLDQFDGSKEQFIDIMEKTMWVSNLFNEIRDKRREDFDKHKTKGIPSANYRCSNVIFKLLEQYGLADLATQVADAVQSRLDN